MELKVNTEEVKRILLEARNFVWLMCKYKYKPQETEIDCAKMLKSENLAKLLFELDSLLAQFGIMMETKI